MFHDLTDIDTFIRFNPKTNRIKEIIFFDYIEDFEYEKAEFDDCPEIDKMMIRMKLDEETVQIKEIRAFDKEDFNDRK